MITESTQILAHGAARKPISMRLKINCLNNRIGMVWYSHQQHIIAYKIELGSVTEEKNVTNFHYQFPLGSINPDS